MSAPSPVGWFDWTDEAFRKAQAEDKPVVLALHAEWCHGCHVMDQATYADPEIAELLNRDYVPIRVDTDRRPDIHERYTMGGWPTVAFLTPEGDLLGGTTYVPRDTMKRLLVQLKVGYAMHRGRLKEEIARRDEKIAQVLERSGSARASLSMEIFRKTVRGIVATFDPAYAGFGQAPKYPLVPSLRVVLQALQETQGPDFQEVLGRTLDAMGDRGLFDAVEGGFFHYSTNDLWTAPRFEKIGEDNAGLISLYLDASVVMGREKYADRARRTLEWARARLWDEALGVFGGSQRADEEYYLLPPDRRARRAAPPVDRTVYTPTVAAFVSAHLRAAEVLGEAEWAQRGLRALEFLSRRCVTDQGVAHYHDGAPRVFELLRDPVALAGALLDAHEFTGDPRFLEEASRIMDAVPGRFWREDEEGLGDRAPAPGDRGDLARPRKQIHENALAALQFARLWRIAGREEHRRWAERILLGFPDFLDGYGHTTAEYAIAADWMVRPPVEVGPDARREYVPRRVVRR
ncbi:MAG: thioredoxin domain-containing protein [Planctomycetota bacterium]